MECPIGLDKMHCQNCWFWRHGKCAYDKIIQQMKRREMTHPLTKRQLQLLRYIANGKSYTEIARALGIAPQTVKNHMTLIKLKLGAKNTAHATAIALRYSLLPLSGVTDHPNQKLSSHNIFPAPLDFLIPHLLNFPLKEASGFRLFSSLLWNH